MTTSSKIKKLKVNPKVYVKIDCSILTEKAKEMLQKELSRKRKSELYNIIVAKVGVEMSHSELDVQIELVQTWFTIFLNQTRSASYDACYLDESLTFTDEELLSSCFMYTIYDSLLEFVKLLTTNKKEATNKHSSFSFQTNNTSTTEPTGKTIKKKYKKSRITWEQYTKYITEKTQRKIANIKKDAETQIAEKELELRKKKLKEIEETFSRTRDQVSNNVATFESKYLWGLDFSTYGSVILW